MSLETASYIANLITSNPDGADARSTADDHLRLIKAVLKRSLPMINGAVSASAQAVTYVNDLTSPVQAQIESLRQGSATAYNAVNAASANYATNAGALGGYSAMDVAKLSSQNTFTDVQKFKRAGTNYLWLEDSTQGFDEKVWLLYLNSGSFALLAEKDNATSGNFAFVFRRTGSAVTAVEFYGTSITFNGVPLNNPTQMNSVAATAYARLDQGQTFNGGQGNTIVSATTGTIDASTGGIHRWTLTSSLSIGAPTAGRSGQVLVLKFKQGGSGSYTVSWSSVFRFANKTVPTLSTTVGSVDIFAFVYDDIDGYWYQAGLDVGR